MDYKASTHVLVSFIMILFFHDSQTLTAEVVFGFSSPALTVHENEGIVHLTVVLNDTHEETTIVTFTTASDTANGSSFYEYISNVHDVAILAPSDYVAVSDSLTFPPGASEQSVSIVIQDDQVLEGTERFLAVLAASGVKVQLVITIQDDDCKDPIHLTIFTG